MARASGVPPDLISFSPHVAPITTSPQVSLPQLSCKNTCRETKYVLLKLIAIVADVYSNLIRAQSARTGVHTRPPRAKGVFRRVEIFPLVNLYISINGNIRESVPTTSFRIADNYKTLTN